MGIIEKLLKRINGRRQDNEPELFFEEEWIESFLDENDLSVEFTQANVEVESYEEECLIDTYVFEVKHKGEHLCFIMSKLLKEFLDEDNWDCYEYSKVRANFRVCKPVQKTVYVAKED